MEEFKTLKKSKGKKHARSKRNGDCHQRDRNTHRGKDEKETKTRRRKKGEGPNVVPRAETEVKKAAEEEVS